MCSSSSTGGTRQVGLQLGLIRPSRQTAKAAPAAPAGPTGPVTVQQMLPALQSYMLGRRQPKLKAPAPNRSALEVLQDQTGV